MNPLRSFRLLCALYWILAMLGLAACNRTLDWTPEAQGRDYFPLDTGRYVEYQVQRILYNELVPDVSEAFELRELVAATFRDLSGVQAWRIERYKRPNDSRPWVIDSVWVVRAEPARIIRTENNIPFVKMVFPTEFGREWNANVLNNLGEDRYRMTAVDQPFRIGTHTFDRSLTIIQQADSNCIARDVRREVYARGIGLVYKRSEVYGYVDRSDDPRFCQRVITNGYFLEMKYLREGRR